MSLNFRCTWLLRILIFNLFIEFILILFVIFFISSVLSAVIRAYYVISKNQIIQIKSKLFIANLFILLPHLKGYALRLFRLHSHIFVCLPTSPRPCGLYDVICLVILVRFKQQQYERLHLLRCAFVTVLFFAYWWYHVTWILMLLIIFLPQRRAREWLIIHHLNCIDIPFFGCWNVLNREHWYFRYSVCAVISLYVICKN